MNKITGLPLLLILIIVSYATNSNSTENRATVYIDPSFGGTEQGPLGNATFSAKNATLDFAIKLKSQLESREISVRLSRENDIFLAQEERAAKSKIVGPKMYIAVTVSAAKDNCVQIYYPERKIPKSNSSDVYYTIIANRSKHIVDRSKMFSMILFQKLNENKLLNCSSVKSKKDYILDSVDSPVIMMDFNISKSGKTKPYVLDETLMAGIRNAVSDAVAQLLQLPAD